MTHSMTYPGERLVSAQFVETVGVPRACLSGREWDRDVYWYAHTDVAGIYRWLPRYVGWHWEAGFPEAPYYLFAISAMRWSIGWLPKSRCRGQPCRLGVLMLDETCIAI